MTGSNQPHLPILVLLIALMNLVLSAANGVIGVWYSSSALVMATHICMSFIGLGGVALCTYAILKK